MASSRKILLSPRTTLLQNLTEDQKKSLGYPPDALPGARDVSTPYGSMRVYEWGDQNGREVIMVHGDATPSPMFGPLARELVARGCRVMTFDLWGRGYTDTPFGCQHDSRLYMQQILHAIVSSPIHWTGPTRFSLIGFSMGGSISLDFFAHQPSLVESIVLLGPGGLIRDLPDEYESSDFHVGSSASPAKIRGSMATLLGVDLDPQPIAKQLSPKGFTPAGALQFQFDHHEGHVESMLSTIQCRPFQNQHSIWEKACKIISGKTEEDTPLCGNKILVICGEDDTVILSEEVTGNLTTWLGEQGTHWVFNTVPGGHGFPFTEGAKIGRMIADFWELE